jgi:hypothetical protein
LTFNWRVRVLTPVVGPWSVTQKFITQLTVPAMNAPINLAAGPFTAAGTVSLTPTLSWQASKSATGYELQVFKDATMNETVVDLTGPKALGATNAYTITSSLGYNKTFYWRVKAITATASTDWSGLATFTTMDVPPVVAPPVIITSQPPVTISIPPAVTTSVVITQAPETKISPTYIWAIIIIGAVLVLAVIVLIVRTRRPV